MLFCPTTAARSHCKTLPSTKPAFVDAALLVHLPAAVCILCLPVRVRFSFEGKSHVKRYEIRGLQFESDRQHTFASQGGMSARTKPRHLFSLYKLASQAAGG